MHPFEVLLRPIVSEKSQMQSGDGRATFEVAKDANKAMIKQAVELAFPQVKVIAEKLPLVLPPHDGVVLKDRFRAALADVLPEKL